MITAKSRYLGSFLGLAADDALESPLSSCRHRFAREIVGIDDEGDVERSVIVPLLKMYEAVSRIRDLSSVDHAVRETISALRDYTLSVEDIKNSVLVTH